MQRQNFKRKAELGAMLESQTEVKQIQMDLESMQLDQQDPGNMRVVLSWKCSKSGFYFELLIGQGNDCLLISSVQSQASISFTLMIAACCFGRWPWR